MFTELKNCLNKCFHVSQRFKYDTEPTRLDRRAECTCRSDTMTNCYNCGHAGTLVLLVQFALAVPGPDAAGTNRTDSSALESNRTDSSASDSDRADFDMPDAVRMNSWLSGDCRSERTEREARPDSGDLSLSVQCPACDSTDVRVTAEDLLARYLSSTTS
jgi:hypothetical protein